MTVPQPRPRLRKPLDAGLFQPEIGSFRLHLAAEGKAAKTVRICTGAVQWFAAAHLIPHASRTRWEEVDRQDVQRWMVWLLGRYSDAYVSNQYRALQQFFKWWAEEEQLPDPMIRERPPKVTGEPVPVFTSGELSALEKACQGGAFAQRRDTAIIAVFKATGIRAQSWPASAIAPATRGAVTWTCGTGTSLSTLRAVSPGSSGLAMRPPAPWTGTSAPGPGTRRRGGRSCGWAPETGGR